MLMTVPRLKIPKIIYMSWITRPEGMPKRMLENFRSWSEVNPDFRVEYFDDEGQRDWMEANCTQYWPAWRDMKLPAGRADLFRYCILHKNGGLWADIDITPLQSLADHLLLESKIVVAHDLGMAKTGFLYNAFLAARAGQPGLKRAMDIVWEHYLQKFRRGAVHCTGPGVLWRAMNETLEGGVEYSDFVGYHDKSQTQYVLFDGDKIWANRSNVPFLKAKYNGYLQDAKYEGREPHFGREVTWDDTATPSNA